MQQITVRGIDPEIEKKIREIARHRRQSINQVIKEIIHKEFLRHESPTASLKQLAGGWTKDEAREFEHAIEYFEQIDEAMWK